MRNESGMTGFKRAIRCKKGSTAVIVAFSFTALMALSALVVDLGRVMMVKTTLQNAVDAAALAAASALPDVNAAQTTAKKYLSLNGTNPNSAVFTFSSNNSVMRVTSTQRVDYTFARVLGAKSTTVSSSASAQSPLIGAAFNYALFSGSTTDSPNIHGSSLTFLNSVHSNSNFSPSCSTLIIPGNCEASEDINLHNGSYINVPNPLPDSAIISMPDFSNIIKLQAQKAQSQQTGHYYDSSTSIGGSNIINVDGGIYVNGDLTINGSTYTGKGCIVATGNITFNGGSITASTSNDAVCFYSVNGNITFNSSSNIIQGIVYAPNGTVSIHTSSTSISGSVVSDLIDISVSNINISQSAQQLQSLPRGKPKLVS